MPNVADLQKAACGMGTSANNQKSSRFDSEADGRGRAAKGGGIRSIKLTGVIEGTGFYFFSIIKGRVSMQMAW